MLDGYKTFISAAVLVVVALIQFYNGNVEEGLYVLGLAFGFVGIRAKLEKI